MGGLSYWGLIYRKFMKEIKGKSILVLVSARFEFARARVFGSQVYLHGLHGP